MENLSNAMNSLNAGIVGFSILNVDKLHLRIGRDFYKRKSKISQWLRFNFILCRNIYPKM